MKDDAIPQKTVSRRTFLQGGTIFLGSIIVTPDVLATPADAALMSKVQIVAPPDETVLPGFLATELQWAYDGGEAPHGVILTVARQSDPLHPVLHVALGGEATTYSLPLAPGTTYTWRLQPTDAEGHPAVAAGRGVFTTGKVLLKEDADRSEQFAYPRKHANYAGFLHPTGRLVEEPISPWFDVKRYTMGPPPKFAEIQDRFPRPVLDGHPDALETYWYCWRTMLDKNIVAPPRPDHQAVANVNGIPDWGPVGSSVIWDLFTVMHFAKYGHQAYPFISAFDNAYARQHRNGFICQETDNNNFEMYWNHPTHVPFLVAFAEWDYYLVSGDVGRLHRVFTPLAKNYEWFMTYQRHKPSGTYGFVTPDTRDEIEEAGQENFELAATAYRAAETLAMARIATAVGRADMAQFFTAEHRRLGDYINRQFWDAQHQLYNDRCDANSLFPKFRQQAGKFVTELKPGDVMKSNYIYTTLFAEIAPPERVRAMKQLLLDPKKGFLWPTGIAYFSLDSTPKGVNPSDPGHTYFKNGGTNIGVWPTVQYTVQHGFKQCGEWAVAQEAGERYYRAIVASYRNEKTLREALYPTQPIGTGHPEFVGWSGLGPVANLIEYVLGMDINVPQRTITWRLHRTERHGLEHLRIGDFYVDLICDERSTANAPCHLTVTSGGAFTLETAIEGRSLRHRIDKGTRTLIVS